MKSLSRKKLGFLAVMVVFVAMLSSYEAIETLTDEAAVSHMNTVVLHRNYLQEREDALVDLIKQGEENLIVIGSILAAIGSARKLYSTAKPILDGIVKIWDNLMWGDAVSVKTIDVDEIDKTFDDSKTFIAEIRARFPESYTIIKTARQDMKLYQFDLANIIKDLELMTDNTSADADRVKQQLNLRATMKGQGGFDGKKDEIIWNSVIQKQIQNLSNSIEECDKIIVSLQKLLKNTKQAKDNLDGAIQTLRDTLQKNNGDLKVKLEDLEKKMEAVGCISNGKELLRAILTFGYSCSLDSPTKIELQNVKTDLKEEQTIILAIDKRMGYFDGLKDAADTLVSESSQVLDLTKSFRQSLVQAKEVLKNDYTAEDIEENMGDLDFANDFATSLNDVLDQLKQKAQEVGAECRTRKAKLDTALTQIDKYMNDDSGGGMTPKKPDSGDSGDSGDTGKAAEGKACDSKTDKKGCADGLRCQTEPDAGKNKCIKKEMCGKDKVKCGAKTLITSLVAVFSLIVAF